MAAAKATCGLRKPSKVAAQETMNRFAALLDRLAYEPRRNAKLRLMQDYFAHTSDPERGWALAALTGSLSFRHAKPNLIRSLIEARTDPVLFHLSRDYVGDLSETVALMWPAPPSPLRGGPSRAERDRGGGAGANIDRGSADTPTRLGLTAESALPTGLLAQPAW